MVPVRIAALVSAVSLGWAAAGLAQDKPKDEALDRLLEKLEGPKTASPAEPAPKPKGEKAPADKPKADAPAPKAADKPKTKPPAEAEPGDKALDSLLEKLGETKEAPKTEGKAQPGEAPPTPDAKPKDAAAEKLDDKQKATDSHLEELTGRAKKKKDQSQEGKGGGAKDDNDPIAQAVKKMREVEQKLGDTDTGEETRKKQGEIVKDLENLIAQAKKQASGQGKPGKKTKQAGTKNMPGDGDKPGDSGDQAKGVGPQKPWKPENVAALVGDKNTWGNLPPQLRDEMDNVFTEKPLEKRSSMIGRYYDAVGKKANAAKGE